MAQLQVGVDTASGRCSTAVRTRRSADFVDMNVEGLFMKTGTWFVLSRGRKRKEDTQRKRREIGQVFLLLC